MGCCWVQLPPPGPGCCLRGRPPLCLCCRPHRPLAARLTMIDVLSPMQPTAAATSAPLTAVCLLPPPPAATRPPRRPPRPAARRPAAGSAHHAAAAPAAGKGSCPPLQAAETPPQRVRRQRAGAHPLVPLLPPLTSGPRIRSPPRQNSCLPRWALQVLAACCGRAPPLAQQQVPPPLRRLQAPPALRPSLPPHSPAAQRGAAAVAAHH